MVWVRFLFAPSVPFDSSVWVTPVRWGKKKTRDCSVTASARKTGKEASGMHWKRDSFGTQHNVARARSCTNSECRLLAAPRRGVSCVHITEPSRALNSSRGETELEILEYEGNYVCRGGRRRASFALYERISFGRAISFIENSFIKGKKQDVTIYSLYSRHTN